MRTGAFVGSVVVGHDRGLAQGFDTYSEPPRIGFRERNRRPGQLVVDDAIAWLQRQNQPFFAWIHLYDAHAPYALPEPYRTMYQAAPYLGGLAVLDAQVGRVIGALEAHHVLDRTLLVVASDHGESLGDHGEDGHGIFVYQSTLRVALIMRVPGLAPRRIADVTRLADVMPTVLDLLQVPAPVMDGVSLVPLMTGRVKHTWNSMPTRNRRTHAGSAGASDLGSVLAARLDALAKAAARRDPPDINVDAETAIRLSALGYIAHGASVPRLRPRGMLAIDPKDCIGRYNEIVRLATRLGGRPAW